MTERLKQFRELYGGGLSDKEATIALDVAEQVMDHKAKFRPDVLLAGKLLGFTLNCDSFREAAEADYDEKQKSKEAADRRTVAEKRAELERLKEELGEVAEGGSEDRVHAGAGEGRAAPEQDGQRLPNNSPADRDSGVRGRAEPASLAEVGYVRAAEAAESVDAREAGGGEEK